LRHLSHMHPQDFIFTLVIPSNTLLHLTATWYETAPSRQNAWLCRSLAFCLTQTAIVQAGDRLLEGRLLTLLVLRQNYFMQF
ncbi:hypothetical protein, partial [Nostoc sp.]|uniref:hypothetical protein n=1 Tax=Nostoc sp. TaxID=1180 RepID=UPI002FF6F3B9